MLRRLVREREGRNTEASTCVLDSHSANARLADQGTDAGKRIIGRKHHSRCDALSLLTVLVTAAGFVLGRWQMHQMRRTV